MKAIRIQHHGGPDALELVEVPLPVPGAGEILVEQTVAGLNYIDVYIRNGTYKREPPFILGREGAGTVASVGAGVTGFKPGDRVAYAETANLGAYAEYVTVPVHEAVPIPSTIDDGTACAVMLQGFTAHYLCNTTFPVAKGDVVLVHAAAGGVGLLLTQLVKARGGIVIATAAGAAKGALARGAGADHVIDYATTDFAPRVKALTGDRGVAAVFDSIGADTWERSLSVLAPRGLLVLFGASSGPIPPLDTQRLAAAGSVFVTRPTLGDFKRSRPELLGRANDLFTAIEAGQLHVRIGATYPLAQAAAAHRDLEARKTTGKVLLTIGGSSSV